MIYAELIINNFVKNVESLIEEEGKNVKAYEKAIGLSNGIINKWKKGTVPALESVYKIAEYHKLSIDDLIGRRIDYKMIDDNKILQNHDDNNSNKFIKLSNNIDSDNDSPLNKYVDWSLSNLERINFKSLKKSNELYNADTTCLEGYNFFDAEYNIDYYLICMYESNPCELPRKIYYCWCCNPAYKLTVISKNSDKAIDIFDYLHEKYSDISGRRFLANNQR
ncbi:MAG: helix-turn-helix transcriptional regulator [Eubacterium sp.]|nr:helix-turn-helix transcriptional regulator [Eubacterium sp.]